MARNKGSTGLTDKQEKFSVCVSKGDNLSDAYRKSYDIKNMSDKTINEKASLMMNNDKVRARVNELRGKVIARAEEKAIFTVESILNDIKELIERNKEKDDRVALEGLKTAAKHLGMFVDKVEHSGEIKMPTITIGK